jgi:hypothetical protein
MRALLLIVLSGAAAVASLIPSEAGAATEPSFTGACTVSGTETFTPPLALASRPGSARVAATGRCSGTLIDASGAARAVRNAAARYEQATSAGSLSCVGGVAQGTGALTINGTSLPFTVTEPQLTVASALSYVAPAWKGFGVASAAPTEIQWVSRSPAWAPASPTCRSC